MQQKPVENLRCIKQQDKNFLDWDLPSFYLQKLLLLLLSFYYYIGLHEKLTISILIKADLQSMLIPISTNKQACQISAHTQKNI